MFVLFQAEDFSEKGNTDKAKDVRSDLIEDSMKEKSLKFEMDSPLIIPGGSKTSLFCKTELDDSNEEHLELLDINSGRIFQEDSASIKPEDLKTEEKVCVIKTETTASFVSEDEKPEDEKPGKKTDTKDSVSSISDIEHPRVIVSDENHDKGSNSGHNSGSKTECSQPKSDKLITACSKAIKREALLSADSDSCLDWTDEDVLDNGNDKVTLTSNDELSDIVDEKQYLVVDSVGGSDSESIEGTKNELPSDCGEPVAKEEKLPTIMTELSENKETKHILEDAAVVYLDDAITNEREMSPSERRDTNFDENLKTADFSSRELLEGKDKNDIRYGVTSETIENTVEPAIVSDTCNDSNDQSLTNSTQTHNLCSDQDMNGCNSPVLHSENVGIDNFDTLEVTDKDNKNHLYKVVDSAANTDEMLVVADEDPLRERSKEFVGIVESGLDSPSMGEKYNDDLTTEQTDISNESSTFKTLPETGPKTVQSSSNVATVTALTSDCRIRLTDTYVCSGYSNEQDFPPISKNTGQDPNRANKPVSDCNNSMSLTPVCTDTTTNDNSVDERNVPIDDLDDLQCPFQQKDQSKIEGTKEIFNIAREEPLRTVAAIAPLLASNTVSNTVLSEQCQLSRTGSPNLANTSLQAVSPIPAMVQSHFLNPPFLNSNLSLLAPRQPYSTASNGLLETPLIPPNFHHVSWPTLNHFPVIDDQRLGGLSNLNLSPRIPPQLQNFQLPYLGSSSPLGYSYSLSPGQLQPWMFTFRYPPNTNPHQPDTFYPCIFNRTFPATLLYDTSWPFSKISSERFKTSNLNMRMNTNTSLPSLKEICTKSVVKPDISEGLKFGKVKALNGRCHQPEKKDAFSDRFLHVKHNPKDIESIPCNPNKPASEVNGHVKVDIVENKGPQRNLISGNKEVKDENANRKDISLDSERIAMTNSGSSPENAKSDFERNQKAKSQQSTPQKDDQYQNVAFNVTNRVEDKGYFIGTSQEQQYPSWNISKEYSKQLSVSSECADGTSEHKSEKINSNKAHLGVYGDTVTSSNVISCEQSNGELTCIERSKKMTKDFTEQKEHRILKINDNIEKAMNADRQLVNQYNSSTQKNQRDFMLDMVNSYQTQNVTDLTSSPLSSGICEKSRKFIDSSLSKLNQNISESSEAEILEENEYRLVDISVDSGHVAHIPPNCDTAKRHSVWPTEGSVNSALAGNNDLSKKSYCDNKNQDKILNEVLVPSISASCKGNHEIPPSVSKTEETISSKIHTEQFDLDAEIRECLNSLKIKEKELKNKREVECEQLNISVNAVHGSKDIVGNKNKLISMDGCKNLNGEIMTSEMKENEMEKEDLDQSRKSTITTDSSNATVSKAGLLEESISSLVDVAEHSDIAAPVPQICCDNSLREERSMLLNEIAASTSYKEIHVKESMCDSPSKQSNTADALNSTLQDFYKEVQPLILDAEIKECLNSLKIKEKELQSVKKDIQDSEVMHNDDVKDTTESEVGCSKNLSEMTCKNINKKQEDEFLWTDKTNQTHLDTDATLENASKATGKFQSNKIDIVKIDIQHTKSLNDLQKCKQKNENTSTSHISCDGKASTLVENENISFEEKQMPLISSEHHIGEEFVLNNISHPDLMSSERLNNTLNHSCDQNVNLECSNKQCGKETREDTRQSVQPTALTGLPIKKGDIFDQSDTLTKIQQSKQYINAGGNTSLLEMDTNAEVCSRTGRDEISEATESVQANEVERRESLSPSLTLKAERDENILNRKNFHQMHQGPVPDEQKLPDLKSEVKIKEKDDLLHSVEFSDLKCVSSISKQICDSDQKGSLLCDETVKIKLKDIQLATDKGPCKVETKLNPLVVGIVNDRTDNDPLKECYIWNGETIPLSRKPVQKPAVEIENISEGSHAKVLEKKASKSLKQVEQLSECKLSTKISVQETVKKSRSKSRNSIATKLNKSSAKSFHTENSSNTKNCDLALPLENASCRQPLGAKSKNVQKKAKQKKKSIDQAVDSFYKEINAMKTDATAFPETKISKDKASCIKAIVDYEVDHGDHEQSDKPDVLPASLDRIVDYDIEEEEDAPDNVYKETCLISKVNEHKLENPEVNRTHQANLNTKTESEAVLPSQICPGNNSLQVPSKQIILNEVNGSSSFAAVLNYVDEDSNSSVKEHESLTENNTNIDLSDNILTFTNTNKLNCVDSDRSAKSERKTYRTQNISTALHSDLIDTTNVLSFSMITSQEMELESQSHLKMEGSLRLEENSEYSRDDKGNRSGTELSFTSTDSKEGTLNRVYNTFDVQQNDSLSETMDSYSIEKEPYLKIKENVNYHENGTCNLDGKGDQKLEKCTRTSQCSGSGTQNVLLNQEDSFVLPDIDTDCTSTVLTNEQSNRIAKIQQSSIAQLSTAYDESSNDSSRSLTHLEQGENVNTCDFQDSLAALKGYANDDSDDSSCDDFHIKDKIRLKSSNNTEDLDILCDVSKSNLDFSHKPMKLVDASSEEIIDTYGKCKWIEEDINSPDSSDTESVHNTSCSSQGTLKVVSDCDDLYTDESVAYSQTVLKYPEDINPDASEKSWKSSPKSGKKSSVIDTTRKQPSEGAADHSEQSDSSIALASSVYDSPVSNISKLSLSKLEERKNKLTHILMQGDSESPSKSTNVYSKSKHCMIEPDLSQKLADIRYWIEQAEEESVVTRERLLKNLQQGWDSECSDDEINDMSKCKKKEYSESVIPNFIQKQGKTESLKAIKITVQNDKMEPSSTEPYKERNEYRLTKTEHSAQLFHQRSRSRSITSNSDSIYKSDLNRKWNKDRERSGSNESRAAAPYRAHSRSRESSVFRRSVSKDTWSDAGSDRSRADSYHSYSSSKESRQSSHYEGNRSRKSKSTHSTTNKHSKSPPNRSSTSRKRTRYSSRRKRSWSRNADERIIRKRESSASSDREHRAESKTTDRRNRSRYRSRSSSTDSDFAKTNRHRGRRMHWEASQTSRKEKVVILHSAALACENLGMYKVAYNSDIFVLVFFGN